MNTSLKFNNFAYIGIPGGLPDPLSYGISEEDISRAIPGAVVCVELRKTVKLGIILAVDSIPKEFEVKALTIHPSGYTFTEQYLILLNTVSENNLCSINKTLNVFLPSQFEKYLNKLPEAPPVNTVALSSDFPTLTPEQHTAVTTLNNKVDEGRYSCSLIHGVTGSGKSRVYMEVGQKVLDAGKNVIILVPEISLTPQTFSVFSNFFSHDIDVIHSNLGEKQKRTSWLRVLTNQSRIIIGTRSAILTPMDNVGLIIIDEEHDASFKQHDPAPRYHARDIAHMIAHAQNAALVLGTATPSIESYHNSNAGKYTLIEMKERVHKQPLPRITIIDMKEQRYLQGDKVLSIPLREKLTQVLKRGEQAIILHNRRGYHTSRLCSSCGSTHSCQDCDIPLIYHKKSNTMMCHYCSRCYTIDVPCAECGSKEFIYTGAAIEKAEEEIQHWIPDAKIIRMDRDTTSRKGSSEKILDAFRSGEFNILLGTQMVAKGHDFPNVELVAIISADTGLNVPDFRTGERMFQLITQVAGRAGRASGSGEVLLQTYNPNDSIIQSAIEQHFQTFAQKEIEERKDLNYPPFMKIAGIEVTGVNTKEVRAVAMKICSFLKGGAPHINALVLGPVEASVATVKRQYRMKILIKAPALNQLRWLIQTALKESQPMIKRTVAIKIDIDPQNTL